MKLISLQEARKANLKRYFTGRTCKYGHITERLTSNRKCFGCIKVENDHNRPKRIARNAERLEEIKEHNRKYYSFNREKLLNKSLLYQKNNKEKCVAKEAKRRAIKLKALPVWANVNTIKEFYKNCPKGYHVDHIVPLQGKNVCGLHVPENLQYLLARENLIKSNSYATIIW